ncbi:hypothetical protein IQ07DRAFT_246443 [Pyrenochaeta sp. DS3sAY3a]|nr:hypothetical protein IQ07DRAFT_246443 [Pyrenochaeta sp. DS3sAY3a]
MHACFGATPLGNESCVHGDCCIVLGAAKGPATLGQPPDVASALASHLASLPQCHDVHNPYSLEVSRHDDAGMQHSSSLSSLGHGLRRQVLISNRSKPIVAYELFPIANIEASKARLTCPEQSIRYGVHTDLSQTTLSALATDGMHYLPSDQA